MRKKIAVLMLIIPILIILAVYTATASAGLNVAVPVRSIKILTPSENGVLNVDIASGGKLYLDVEVQPSLAKNKKYSVIIDNLDNTDCGLSVDDNTGLISATDEGKAKITVKSNDGGFTDSLIVIADSSSIFGFVPIIYDDEGNKAELTPGLDGADYSVSLNSDCERYGFSATIKPTSLSQSDVVWASSDEKVLKIDPSTGAAVALLPGKVRVTATPDNSDMLKTIDVTVEAPAFPSSGVLVNGKTETKLVAGEDAQSVKFFVQTRSGNKPTITGGIGTAAFTKVNGVSGAYEVTLGVSAYPDGETNVSIDDGSGAYNLKISYRSYAFKVFTGYDQDGDGNIIQKADGKTSYIVFGNYEREGVRFEWSAAGAGVKLYPSADGRKCTVETAGTGEYTLTAKAYSGTDEIFSAETRVKTVLNVSALVFDENSVDYGIGGILTLGNRVWENGEYKPDAPALNLRMKTPMGFLLYEGTDDVVLTLSGNSASLAENGTALNITGDGKITLSAKWKYAEYFKEETKAELTVKTVNGGVNVSTYEQLKTVSEDGKVIVLRGNIMLGKKNASLSELEAMVKTMPTTYDWQYYENIGKDRPEINYIIEFKNDVYGNGFELNAEYIANAHDRTGRPLIFKGPLDFVAMKGTAAVKGQDNVSFLIRNKGVTLDNVVLKSCSDSSLYVGGELDLSRLRYVGTTLEIAADTVVQNSRISNGRTVVRVFGGGVSEDGSPIVDSASEVNVAEEKITAKIESSILSNAREFILKIGTNRAIRARDSENGKNIKVAELTDANGNSYPVGGNHLDDDYFVNNYLLTDVTLKNSVLYNSGVFSVGIDTHFSGEMLWRGEGVLFMPNGWGHIAATSFASVLRLEGDVKIYDWKQLDKVDSSTLIETTSGLSSEDSYLKLNISAMLDKVYASGKGENIFTEIDGVKYVHGGIAFYGGGKNYSVMVADKTSAQNAFLGEAFNNYNINLSILAEGAESIFDPLYLQGTQLPLAAGTEDFRFYIYGSNSESSYQRQLTALEDGSAFDWIVPVS